MTPERRSEIESRWQEIDRELAELAQGRVVPDASGPAAYESKLLEEQDALEYELGLAYFEDRDSPSK